MTMTKEEQKMEGILEDAWEGVDPLEDMANTYRVANELFREEEDDMTADKKKEWVAYFKGLYSFQKEIEDLHNRIHQLKDPSENE